MKNHSLSRQVRLSTVPLIIEQRTGDKPHIVTVYRWVNQGLRGVKLRTSFVGGHRRTTEEWLDEFFKDIFDAHVEGELRKRRDRVKANTANVMAVQEKERGRTELPPSKSSK